MDIEYDINRDGYEKSIEEIRKEKRKLRNIQEPALVKKIKKELKAKQRAAKRSDKNNLKKYFKDQIENYNNEDNG